VLGRTRRYCAARATAARPRTASAACRLHETCPVSTEGWTRRVHFVREGGRGGGVAVLLVGPSERVRGRRRAVRRFDREPPRGKCAEHPVAPPRGVRSERRAPQRDARARLRRAGAVVVSAHELCLVVELLLDCLVRLLPQLGRRLHVRHSPVLREEERPARRRALCLVQIRGVFERSAQRLAVRESLARPRGRAPAHPRREPVLREGRGVSDQYGVRDAACPISTG